MSSCGFDRAIERDVLIRARMNKRGRSCIITQKQAVGRNIGQQKYSVRA